MNCPAFLARGAAAALVLFGAACFGSEGTVSNAPVMRAEETNSQELMRSYVQLQEQLHQAQLSIDQTRKEARETAMATAEALTTQLKAIEAALASQRARELEAMQTSNRIMLIMAGTFATLGFAAMVLMAYFQWRTVHGLAEISAVLPAGRGLGQPSSVSALGLGELQTSRAAEASTAKLLGALEQLEKRILGLERPQRPALEAGKTETAGGQNGDEEGEGQAGPGQAGEGSVSPERGVRGWLSRGQALLDQDDPAAALAQFEQVLTLNPGHPEALVKKGAALERLGQLREAVECYDRAIVADSTLTVAYLHKGGLFNRMEKFSEALDCYEKALRTQEKRV